MLKWKDSQGLVFWMMDDYNLSDNNSHCDDDQYQNPLINPFWYYLSKQLNDLIDPVTRKKYNALHLDEKWWRSKGNYVSKYDTKISSVLSELYFKTMKYKIMQEIIYQSNPMSLYPVTEYGNVDISTMRLATNSEIELLYDANDTITNVVEQENDDGNSGNWYISDDYDPYDLDVAIDITEIL